MSFFGNRVLSNLFLRLASDCSRGNLQSVTIDRYDGTKIAFCTDYGSGGNAEVYVMNSDGSNQTNITNYDPNDGSGDGDWEPDWSPNGSQILFRSDRQYQLWSHEIWVMNPDGGNPQRLTNNPAGEGHATWAPDGKLMAFQSDRDGNYEIYVMNFNDFSVVRLTDNPSEDTFPSWSPDGSHIAFQSNRDGNYEIYVMNSDGSDQNRITNDPSDDVEPSWGALHEVAVTNIRTSKTGCHPIPAIGYGEELPINVTLENHGDIAESFNVYIYANDSVILTLAITNLDANSSLTESFTWNTIGFEKGRYAISAYAEPVLGETNTSDNHLFGEVIAIVTPGDINADSLVDIFDIARIAVAFGSAPTESHWGPNADINGDGIIDIFDIVIVAIHFGEA